jgi:hypothetical protein
MLITNNRAQVYIVGALGDSRLKCAKRVLYASVKDIVYGLDMHVLLITRIRHEAQVSSVAGGPVIASAIQDSAKLPA